MQVVLYDGHLQSSKQCQPNCIIPWTLLERCWKVSVLLLGWKCPCGADLEAESGGSRRGWSPGQGAAAVPGGHRWGQTHRRRFAPRANGTEVPIARAGDETAAAPVRPSYPGWRLQGSRGEVRQECTASSSWNFSKYASELTIRQMIGMSWQEEMLSAYRFFSVILAKLGKSEEMVNPFFSTAWHGRWLTLWAFCCV